ncbi:MAG TPA: VCBS repeat-containing protein [Pyrinomonadaceae bacterium]|jgi:hypothetical protein
MKDNFIQVCKAAYRNLFHLTIPAVFMLLLSGISMGQASNPGKTSLPSGFQQLKSRLKQPQKEIPLSGVFEFIKPGADKTIRLPELSEAQKSTFESGKKTQIGVIRKLERKVQKISDGTFFSVDRGSIWIAEIVSKSAVQTRLHFSDVNLSKGSRLSVYSAKNSNDKYNFFEENASSENGGFWTPPIDGDDIVIEYFTPSSGDLSKEQLPFRITQVSHIYRTGLENCSSESNLSSSPPQFPTCHKDVPIEWEEVARSVGLLQFTTASGEFICNGTLLNSVAQDYNPILLTANQCFNTQASAQSLRVYWFYETGDSPSSDLPHSDGATLLSAGAATDHTLVLIKGSVPTLENVAFSGWDGTTNPIGTSVVGFHNPRGSYRRFSAGTTISGFCPTLPGACQNYTGVSWNQGIIESGGQGSGLWKGTDYENSRLIGTLTTGTIGCTNPRDSYSSFGTTYQSISSHLQGGTDDNSDAAGGNDFPQNAVAIQPGARPNLVVKWLDDDWYSINVPAGYKITATADFVHEYGDIDLELFRPPQDEPVATSYSVGNNETVSHISNSSTTYYLYVYLYDGARNNYNLNISLQQVSAAPRTPFDFDGDGKADISVFRPSNGSWYVSRSLNNSFFGVQFGSNGDLIAPADFDADGKADFTVFRNGFWYRLNSSTNQFVGLQFGSPGDLPVPGDFDGDGKADIAVFRPSNGAWYWLNSSNNQFNGFQWGSNGDKPQVGDFDDDGKTDLAVFRPANGAWYILRSSNNSFFGIGFGSPGDIPAAADYDGDGKTDVAVFRPSAGAWYRLNSSTGQFFGQQFGISEDRPVAADYDGDGKADIAVFRPSNGAWYLQRSTAGFTGQQFGAGGDVPTPAAFGR